MTAGQKDYAGEQLPLAALEEQLIALASDIAAAESRWLQLVAEFDRRDGWAGVGVKSCAHWLSWRCGLGLKAAREKVRVARALTVLPMVADAFDKGELSYCRARAITRAASPENEEVLLEMARHSTGAQLERIVRATVGAQRLEDVAERAARRSVSWHWDEDGSLVLRARLDPVEGAAVLCALEAAQALDKVDARGADAGATPEKASAEASPLVVMQPAEGAETAEEPATVGDGAASGDGPAPVDNGGRDAPAEEPPSREELAVSRVDALVAIAEAYVGSRARVSGADVYQVVVQVRDGTPPHVEDGPALPVETALRLACDASMYCVHVDERGDTQAAGRRTRAISPGLRRALWYRDGGCRFPGCGRRRRVDAHHVRHWAHGGPTVLPNLVLLCRRHHGLVHEGGFGLRMTKEGRPEFTSPAGVLLPEVPEPVLSTQSVRAWHRRPVSGVAVETRWTGERLDLVAAVDAVIQAARWSAATTDGSAPDGPEAGDAEAGGEAGRRR